MKKILILVFLSLGFLFAQDVITSETSEVTTQATNSTHVAGNGSDHANVATNTTHGTGDGSDHADVATNTTHITADGSAHANVATNTTHITADGSAHANVATNTTHITADGSAHANVATNTTHITADGSAHANVATNTTHITADGSAHANVATNTTHAGSDGKDHADVVTNTSGVGTLNTQAGIEAVLVDADLNIGTGSYISNANAGTAGADVVAVEYGSGFHHITVLTLTGATIGTPNANNNSAHGLLIYTFPAAGVHIHDWTYSNIGFTVGTIQTDAPDVGIGSTEATGANATLNGGTQEDYLTAQTWASTLDGTAEIDGPLGATAGYNSGISMNMSGDTKTVYLNVADGWDTGVTGDLTVDGTIILIWDFLE